MRQEAAKRRRCTGHLPAFTLIELMVVMALAAIVIALGWTIYRNFYAMSTDHYERARRVQEWLALDRYIQNDCSKARQVRIQENVLSLEKISGEGNVKYEIGEEKVLRRAGGEEQLFSVRMNSLRIDSGGSRTKLNFILADSSREMNFCHLLPEFSEAVNASEVR